MTEHQVKKSQARRLVEAIKKLSPEQASVFEQTILGVANYNDIEKRFGNNATARMGAA